MTNGQDRQGGIIPSRAGQSTGSLSKVVNMRNGDGSNCIHTPSNDYETKKWYVLRATNNRTLKAEKDLNLANITTYVPKHYVIKNVFGIKRRFQESLLPGLLFVFSSRREIDNYRKEFPVSAEYTKYYLNKSDKKEGNGLNPPMTIRDCDMQNFMKVCNVSDSHTIPIDPKSIRFKSNDEVIITRGDFIGVRGRVVRVAGQQRVAVILNDAIGVATAYIPSAFLEVVKGR